VPDEGSVKVAGRDTRDIATDTEWLTSLDRFGIVTHRAVLLDGMSVAANLALPITIAIDPLSEEIRSRVEKDAVEVGPGTCGARQARRRLTTEQRLRLHLSRAAANGPEFMLLEHPAAQLEDAASAARAGEGAARAQRVAADSAGWRLAKTRPLPKPPAPRAWS
jgi:ABC-type lipoprotein export system ATPase subunit